MRCGGCEGGFEPLSRWAPTPFGEESDQTRVVFGDARGRPVAMTV